MSILLFLGQNFSVYVPLDDLRGNFGPGFDCFFAGKGKRQTR
jgi:hypothetical protein